MNQSVNAQNASLYNKHANKHANKEEVRREEVPAALK